MNVLVTGGAGFIGSAVVRHLLRDTDAVIIDVDKLTYAGNLDSLAEVADHPRHRFVQADICDAAEMASVFAEHHPSLVMHLAAESHVDRSIDGPSAFITTNILGTYSLLEAARAYWSRLPDDERAGFRFHHVSTDEVYGSLGETGSFTEESPYRPNSPYSASKASSDHLVRAWHHTYGLPVVTSNCSNNYGPFQFPEKLIPLCILKGLRGESIPVYGRGDNVRDWLYVEDHARALEIVMRRGHPGETYNIGGHNEKTNLEVVRAICDTLDDLSPEARIGRRTGLIVFVPDRPGHDRRYAIDASKARRRFGWTPQETFDSGLRRTVEWYLENRAWWERVLDGRYRCERLGLGVN